MSTSPTSNSYQPTDTPTHLPAKRLWHRLPRPVWTESRPVPHPMILFSYAPSSPRGGDYHPAACKESLHALPSDIGQEGITGSHFRLSVGPLSGTYDPRGGSPPHHSISGPPRPTIYQPGNPSILSSTECPSAQYPSEVRLHDHLVRPPKRRDLAAAEQGLVWDIIHPPQVSKVFTRRNVIIKPNMKACAMEPTTGPFELWTDYGVLDSYMRKWGPVLVKQSHPTVETILDAIYEYLQVVLSQDDLSLVLSNRKNAGPLDKARKERARDGFELYDVAVQGPFRRSDVVGSHRRFRGIRAVRVEDGSLALYFDLGPIY